MIINILYLLLGLTVLIFSGDYLVKGAVGIAKKFNISPLVIGMTVVSFGTSAPELFVSVQSVFDGESAIAVGNIVGSNIANIALVLAITVLIFPIVIDRNSKLIDWPMMFGSSLLFYLFALDNQIVLWEGLLLLALLIIFIIFIIWKSRKAPNENEEELDAPKQVWLTYVFLIGGLVGLKFGADWMLDGAVGIAKELGMSSEIIGVTIIAFGTSVPELVASGVAAYRKQTDISIGNLIGSNIFNVMAVIGITSSLKTVEVTNESLDFHFLWMLAIAFALLPLMLLGKKMGRVNGLMLLIAYLTYITICILKVTGDYDLIINAYF